MRKGFVPAVLVSAALLSGSALGRHSEYADGAGQASRVVELRAELIARNPGLSHNTITQVCELTAKEAEWYRQVRYEYIKPDGADSYMYGYGQGRTEMVVRRINAPREVWGAMNATNMVLARVVNKNPDAGKEELRGKAYTKCVKALLRDYGGGDG